MELAREVGVPRIVLDVATTLAQLEQRAQDPDTSQRTFEKIVAQARADGDVAAELRGLSHLGSLHFELRWMSRWSCTGRPPSAAETYVKPWR